MPLPIASPIPARKYVFFISIFLALANLAYALLANIWFLLPALIFIGLAVVGILDLRQKRHSVLRNYPILGHFRYMFESIRPEMRQYFFESNLDGTPFSREKRSLVYDRAKDIEGNKPFGTEHDLYAEDYSWMNHSMVPKGGPGKPRKDPRSDETLRVLIGGPDCTKPYSASLFNISAMSFGALSANAITALNSGAAMGNFAHDTGEGGISRYHKQPGGDLIWEIGSGYFGCRSAEGGFDPVAFATQAALPQVKMIEIKLSQGAKPGHGGVLPAPKVSEEIAEARGVTRGEECVSPSAHSAFSTPLELVDFIIKLRNLSEGKPVGIKLCLGHKWEFMALVKAMIERDAAPDFIVIDGAEGGTGAAPLEFSNHLGTPLRQGLVFVHNTLIGAGLRQRISLGASGKLITAFDIAATLSLGADWVNSARGFMFSIGCIQSQSCHTNRCPVGVATQDPQRQEALVVPEKSIRVANFHRNTLRALSEFAEASGLDSPRQLQPEHIYLREGHREILPASAALEWLKKGALLIQNDIAGYSTYWKMAQASSFEPIKSVEAAHDERKQDT
ncbi:FMN-binding glutamate synthase family protein [Roseibium sp.]|uniref:FMN-binding glutamate synthase family protein n=1 Tax=Roseibium sp. TaxID=1936156 RepID=UPI003A978157